MSNLSMTLTDKAIGALPFAQNGRYRVHDSDLKGFMVIVGKRGKTFYAEGYFWEDGKRQFSMMKKISDAGEITAREARGKAKEILGAIAKGIRPGETQRRTEPSLTLQSAWERYRKAHLVRKNRSQNTNDNYENDLRLHLKDWLNMPLEQLGKLPKMVMKHHDFLTDNHGPAAANGAMRTLRAIYNHAAKSESGPSSGQPDARCRLEPDAASKYRNGPKRFEWLV